MTKLVAIRTIEHGARRALAILGDDGVERAIEETLGLKRSASLIRKCADPDDDGHHLQSRYAVALDVGCHRAGQPPPLLDAHRYLIERHVGAAPDNGQAGEGRVQHAVLMLQAALGELSQTVGLAVHEDGPGGTRLTNREKHEIHEAIAAIDHKAEAIKRLIAA
jgi:Phage regulatory protein CII (CP76)